LTEEAKETGENRAEEENSREEGRKADHPPGHPPVSNRQQHRLQSHHRSALRPLSLFTVHRLACRTCTVHVLQARK